MAAPIIEEDEVVGPRLRMRPYQNKALEETSDGWKKGFTRQLIDMATGLGKGAIFSKAAHKVHERGNKTLIIIDREFLVRKTAARITEETGVETDIEMAGSHASPYSPIVVASVQSLQNESRLTSWADDHFALVVADECHHSGSDSWSRILMYFHFGAHSLAEDWKMPLPGEPYKHKAAILGLTATPDLVGSHHLSTIYQRIAYQYQLAEGINDGWLVPIIQENIPLNIDIRGLKAARTPHGSDYTDNALTKLIEPVIEALADQVRARAMDRKTIAFVPSIKCAQLLADAVTRRGMNGIFVSGACEDVDEKNEAYIRGGSGTVLCNAALHKEGSDFPDTSCIGIFRATKKRGFYAQMAGRGTRPLPGVVDPWETAEERKAAIAASAKKDLLILDPTWRVDSLDLCNYYDLVTSVPEVKERMMAAPRGDLVEMAREAERDFIAALEKEARKHKNKQARKLNPVAFALSVGDARLATYVPQTAWEAAPARKPQIEFIIKAGLNPADNISAGLADKVIGILVERERLKLATPEQMNFLKKLTKPVKAPDGQEVRVPMFSEEALALMPKGQAQAICGRMMQKFRG